MKRLLLIFRPVALFGIGLLLAMTSAALSQPALSAASLNEGAMAARATPTLVPGSEVGSTDWITLVSVIIVLIIVIPILLRRRTWSN